MKKIISILLAIIMCFSMTTVAFAAEEETPEVSKDGIISVLLEAAKIASTLNEEARKAMSEELKKLLVEQIAGDNPFFQSAAEWIVDKAIDLSGNDNLLTLNKEQAENLADFLTKIYDGNIADYIDNPLIKFVVNFIPEEVLKEAVVWILSDGFGDTLRDFIDKYGDGEGSDVGGKPEEDKPSSSNPLEGMDWVIAISAALQAVRDFFDLIIKSITDLFSGLVSTPAPTV
ncbi:MAG: hypothetical protein IKL16_05675 [Clostridia bacterium]|nr:hypothetical protein [Clostridia bacterium]